MLKQAIALALMSSLFACSGASQDETSSGDELALAAPRAKAAQMAYETRENLDDVVQFDKVYDGWYDGHITYGARPLELGGYSRGATRVAEEKTKANLVCVWKQDQARIAEDKDNWNLRIQEWMFDGALAYAMWEIAGSEATGAFADPGPPPVRWVGEPAPEVAAPRPLVRVYWQVTLFNEKGEQLARGMASEIHGRVANGMSEYPLVEPIQWTGLDTNLRRARGTTSSPLLDWAPAGRPETVTAASKCPIEQ